MENKLSLDWQGDENSVLSSNAEIIRTMLKLETPIFAIEKDGKMGITNDGELGIAASGVPLLGFTPPLPPSQLGDPGFCQTYRTKYSYYAGAMANGIASVDLVTALGKAGFLGSFGAGGLAPAQVEAAIQQVQETLPDGPYAFNLLNSPNEPALEECAVGLYLKYNVPVIEASAYVALTAPLVYYRLSGLSRAANGKIAIGHRVIAKLSRLEMGKKFLEPVPEELVSQLLEQKKVTPEQAELARQVPMADDITVEADSGGHTDNRPLVCMLPAFLALRDEVQAARQYAQPVRIGAAGGIGTPGAAMAAFAMGAAYIATGSINQGCVEAGASEHTRNLLAQMDMADVVMAPAGDMFEMGVKVQVLKRGTMFPMRAQKLYELYTRYNAWEEIPATEREKLEKTVFKREFDAIWNDTVAFFSERDPHQVERGNANPRDKMALVFRWYLGLSSRWSNSGEKDREMDYQIWTGPAMGAFNNWVKGTYLESPQNRHVADVAKHILTGCAYLTRVRMLEAQGVSFAPEVQHYIPTQGAR